MSTNYKYTFTIFIPTYNRVHLLSRAFASIEAQNYRDFEVVIIDDGSTDNTGQVVEQWASKVDFPVRYFFTQNQGKPVAHNKAIDLARGFFTAILDSDDTLAPNALSILKQHWDNIPPSQRECFSGVEGHCALLSTRQLAGDLFPEDVFDSNYLEIRHRYRIGGDKKNAIRTDVLKRFPFPHFSGEKHIRESIVWNRIAVKYQTRYVNEIVQYIEYQPDGLSSDIFWRRVNNPQGFRLAHMEMVNLFNAYVTPVEIFNEMAKYVRYSFHSKIAISQQIKDIDKKILWLLALPKGSIDFLRDGHKKRKRRHNA